MNFLPLLLEEDDKSSPFKNRLRKNYRHIRKWAKQSLTDAFRIYDRDIKEYPLAIDFYAGRFFIHFFSYDHEEETPAPLYPNELKSRLLGRAKAPGLNNRKLINISNIDQLAIVQPRELSRGPKTAFSAHLGIKEEIEGVLRSLFGTSVLSIDWRVRMRRKRVEQYEKIEDKKEFFTVQEYGVKFKINFSDYLDTGLFLDHRETRQMVAALSSQKRLLNLFAYTCSFSVQAAAKGAHFTKSVDLSNTYTAWGKENFLLNNLSLKTNVIVRADCLTFLEEEVASGATYDVIVIDPPTISRSKKMEQMFDIQEDYYPLLSSAIALLNPGGVIFFSTNSRHFRLDETLFSDVEIREITKKTIPLDFHQQKIHQCWTFSSESC